MSKWIYAGSFDPVTIGHMDIIKRAISINDEIIVAILINNEKKALFTLEERIDMLKKVTEKMGNVRIMSFEGLLMDFAKEIGAQVLVRGLRTVSDFDYEFRMAALNKCLDKDVETVFIMADTKYSYISSSAVKEIGLLGGDVSGMIPECVKKEIYNKFKGDEQ